MDRSTGEPIDRNRRAGRTYRRPTRAAAARARRPGRQGRSGRNRHGAQRHLCRRRLRFLVWVPTWAALDALDALSTAIKIRKVNWILDADIQNFFGAVNED